MLGFALSGVVQAVVTKGEMGRLLPDSRPRTILLASGLGAASSCSYAAVALARSLFRKGGRQSARSSNHLLIMDGGAVGAGLRRQEL